MADNTADGLTAEHRARIEAVLAPEGRVMTPEAWAELEEFVVCYRIWETRRTTYPIDEERKRWKRLGEAVDTVADELRREKLWASPDPTWRDRALTMLSKVRRKVELRALLHKAWGSPFSRRQTSTPETSGSMRSSSIRSGRCSATAVSASRPVPTTIAT